MKHKVTQRHETAATTRAVHSPTGPRMTWVAVTDARGRERLVARWSDPALVQSPSAAAHAA